MPPMKDWLQTLDETSYRHLVSWCSENDLELHFEKRQKMANDFRKNKPDPQPLITNGKPIEIVNSFEFLGIS